MISPEAAAVCEKWMETRFEFWMNYKGPLHVTGDKHYRFWWIDKFIGDINGKSNQKYWEVREIFWRYIAPRVGVKLQPIQETLFSMEAL